MGTIAHSAGDLQGPPVVKTIQTAPQLQGWQVGSDGLEWLRARGISDATIDALGIRPHKSGCTFDALPGAGTCYKAADSNATPKYSIPDGWKLKNYHARDLALSVQLASGHLWLAGGFMDVWTLHSAGLQNALSFYGGDQALPAGFADALIMLGVRVVHYAPDRDASGLASAAKVRAALDGSGVLLRLYQLPGDVGSKADLNALWLALEGNAARFVEIVHTLPPLALPDADPAPLAAREIAPVQPRGVGRVLDDPGYWSDRALTDDFADRNAAAVWLACQLRDAGHAQSAAEQVLAQFAQQVTTSAAPFPTSQARATVRSVYRKPARDAVILTETAPASLPSAAPSLPTSAREELAQRGHTGIARLLDGLYSAGARPGELLTVQDMAARHPVMGYRAIYRVMQKWANDTAKDFQPTPTGAAEGDFSGTPEFLTLSGGNFFPSVQVTSQSVKNSKRGRKATAYRVPSPAEICTALGIQAHGNDALPEWAMKSNGHYRAAGHRALIARKPGEHCRAFLGRRWGVNGNTTAQWETRYPELADVLKQTTERPLVGQPDELPTTKYQARKWRREGKRLPFVRDLRNGETYLATRWRVAALQHNGAESLEYFTYGPNTYRIAPDPLVAYAVRNLEAVAND